MELSKGRSVCQGGTTDRLFCVSISEQLPSIVSRYRCRITDLKVVICTGFACLNNLAQLLKATNRLAEAEPLMRRALAIVEQSYGGEHPDVAINLSNLAGLL